MTLQQLRYVITIVNCGSISEAAKQLFITQPSLSNSLKELEAELGITIFTRTSRGITLSLDGTEFLTYARQVVEQAELLEQHYMEKKPGKRISSISTQHYAFAVNAFANVVSRQNNDEYEFTLRETRTYEIINDVKNYRSELGILYLNEFNRKVLEKLLKESGLVFTPLFRASAHVFLCSEHPLSCQSSVSIEDLEPYPFLAFEQGEQNFFYFSEEILSTIRRKKVIYVSDRATLFNLLIRLNGYTICSGILNSNLNGDNIIALPLETDEDMTVGWIHNPKVHLSQFAQSYLEELNTALNIKE
jgi:DNA-binding transcriptional LysR family regulator